MFCAFENGAYEWPTGAGHVYWVQRMPGPPSRNPSRLQRKKSNFFLPIMAEQGKLNILNSLNPYF